MSITCISHAAPATGTSCLPSSVIHYQQQQPTPPTQAPVAPTFTIHATRLGMVGGRTTNGHIIQPHDHFVALPSPRALCSHGGYEYQVRITYNGRSAVAPVWDVGPWNTKDDYWSEDREMYKDLPRGWPQDHAAYFDGHNNGYAEHGYVRFPTAMDVADGIWWNELGIVGDQAVVDVTFLWLGEDPLAQPPDPNQKEFVVREQSQAFHSESVHGWYHSIGGCGANNHAYWTYTVSTKEKHENLARWQPDLAQEDLYHVYVHIPNCPTDSPVTPQATYRVHHRDGVETITVNQALQTGWVSLGQFPFAAGKEGFIYLDDIAGVPMHVMWFDDVKWVRGEEPDAPPQEAISLPLPPAPPPPPVPGTRPSIFLSD